MPISTKAYKILKFISLGNKTLNDVTKKFDIAVSRDDTFLSLDDMRAWNYLSGNKLELTEVGLSLMEEYERKGKLVEYSLATAMATGIACVIALVSLVCQSCKSCS